MKRKKLSVYAVLLGKAVLYMRQFRVELVMTTSITLRVIFQPNLSNLNLGKWREKLERKLFDIFDCTAKSLINQGFSKRHFQCDLWFSSADPSASWVHLRIKFALLFYQNTLTMSRSFRLDLILKSLLSFY